MSRPRQGSKRATQQGGYEAKRMHCNRPDPDDEQQTGDASDGCGEFDEEGEDDGSTF